MHKLFCSLPKRFYVLGAVFILTELESWAVLYPIAKVNNLIEIAGLELLYIFGVNVKGLRHFARQSP